MKTIKIILISRGIKNVTLINVTQSVTLMYLKIYQFIGKMNPLQALKIIFNLSLLKWLKLTKELIYR